MTTSTKLTAKMVQDKAKRLHSAYLKKIRMTIGSRKEESLNFNPVMDAIYLSISEGDFYDDREIVRKIHQISNTACTIAENGRHLTKEHIDKLKESVAVIYKQVCNTCIQAELMTTDFSDMDDETSVEQILVNLLLKRDPNIENPLNVARELLLAAQNVVAPEFTETVETEKERFSQLVLKIFGDKTDSEHLLNALTEQEI